MDFVLFPTVSCVGFCLDVFFGQQLVGQILQNIFYHHNIGPQYSSCYFYEIAIQTTQCVDFFDQNACVVVVRVDRKFNQINQICDWLSKKNQICDYIYEYEVPFSFI